MLVRRVQQAAHGLHLAEAGFQNRSFSTLHGFASNVFFPNAFRFGQHRYAASECRIPAKIPQFGFLLPW